MEPEFERGAAGWEARMLPLCFAAPWCLKNVLPLGVGLGLIVEYTALVYALGKLGLVLKVLF